MLAGRVAQRGAYIQSRSLILKEPEKREWKSLSKKVRPHLRLGFSIGGIPLRRPRRTKSEAPEFTRKKKLPAL